MRHVKRCIWNAQWRSPIPQYHCLFACWHLMGTQLPSTLLPGSLGQVATTLIRFWLIVVCCQKTANCWLFKMFLFWSITTTGSSGFIWPFSFGFCICQNLLITRWRATQVTPWLRAAPKRGPVRRRPLQGPIGASLCAHPGLGCWSHHANTQLPVTVTPPPATTTPPSTNRHHTIIRVNNGCMAGVVLKRPVVNEQHKQKTLLVLHLPAFNDMDSATIKAAPRATCALRAFSLFFSFRPPPSVSSAMHSLASTANRVVSEKERREGTVVYWG